MTQKFGYLIELSNIKLNDDMTSEIMVFPYGKYDHPVYGELNFTPEVGADVVKNFEEGARGQDLDIDYDHKTRDGIAAGWIKKVITKNDGVYALVEWTKKAWDHIQNKEYRYFSPEFMDEWTHPSTGQKFKNILFGGGITNRPFLKGILPINMSELGMPSERPQEGTGMDPERLRELLGLPKDATDEQVETALAERSAGGDGGNGDGDGEPGAEGGEQGKEKEPVAAGEGLPQEVIQLAESNPAVKALTDHVVALSEQLSTTQKALRLSEVSNTVKKLTEGKNALPASVSEELTKFLSESDVQTANNMIGLLEKIQSTGFVQLDEHGRGREGDAVNDAAKQFSDAVAKVMSEDKLDYGDAVERVAQLNPQLYSEYRGESYAFKEAN